MKVFLKKTATAVGLLVLIAFGLAALYREAGAAAELKVDKHYSAAGLVAGQPSVVTIVVTVVAPELARAKDRPPVAVSLIIDRSGSMSEAKKLTYAVQAGKTLVRALGPADYFGLVIYDDTVEELIPLSIIKDKAAVYKLLDKLEPGGYTFLSGGLEAGLEQFKGRKLEGAKRLVLLSDGLANHGVTDPEGVAAIGARARAAGIGVSAIGLGADYDEKLMQLLAQRGGGQYYYVKDSEDLPSVFKEELALTADLYTRDLKLAFTPSAAVKTVKIYGYNVNTNGQARNIDMSDLAAGEKRQIVLRLEVTPQAGQTDQSLGDLKLNFSGTEDKKTYSQNIPLSLTMLADDKALAEANQREAAAIQVAVDEGILQEAEEAHVAAMEALAQGDRARADAILTDATANLAMAAPENKAAVNKAQAIKHDQARLEEAAADQEVQKSMTKAAKSSAYQSSQGKQQGYMLQRGDQGFMVEKLQNALTAKGFYQGEINGQYGPEVEEAVKKFQKNQGIEQDGLAGPATQKALGLL